MSNLNLDVDFFDHPKTKRLIGLLGRGAEVLPLRLWCYCGKYHADSGRLAGLSAQEIESLVGWWGKPTAGIGAMEKVGFVDRDGDEYKVHDWGEHAGHLLAFKIRGKKAAKRRWEKIAGECLTDASSMQQASHKQCSIPLNQPNQPTAADDPPDARGFARAWVSSNCPQFLKPGCLSPFERLISAVGKRRAVELVNAAIGRGGVSNPFAYAETVHTSGQAGEAVRAAAAPKRLTKAKVYDV